MSYEGKLKTQLYWWLSKARPFIINDEYKIELLFVDRDNLSAKILITNLKEKDAGKCEGCTSCKCHETSEE